MPIRFNNFVFAAPPRMASTWFRTACAIADQERPKRGSHDPFSAQEKMHRVTLVRHPVAWLSSMYYALNCGTTGVRLVDMLSLQGDRICFAEFAEWYLLNEPGLVGRICGLYKADTTLRVEDLPSAAVAFFRSMGVGEAALASIAAMPPVNCWTGLPPQKMTAGQPISAELRARIMAAESAYCSQWGYT